MIDPRHRGRDEQEDAQEHGQQGVSDEVNEEVSHDPAGGVVRNFFIHFIRDALLAVLLSVLLFIATTMSWVYHGLQALALNAMMPVPPQWFDYASFGLSLALSALMFYFAYRLVPRQRPGVGAALSGAMLASLLWEAAKQLFRLYVQ